MPGKPLRGSLFSTSRRSRPTEMRKPKERDKGDEDVEDRDKDWAKRYILDPLTAPEPSQLDGPGTSFFNPRRSLSLSSAREPPTQPPPAWAAFQIHHPKPISPGRRHSYLPPAEWAPADVVLTRSQSLNPATQRPLKAGPGRHRTLSAQPPNFEASALQAPPRRKPAAAPVRPTQTATPAKPTAAKAEARFSRPDPSPRPPKSTVCRRPPQTHFTQRTAEILCDILSDTTRSHSNRPPPVLTHRSATPLGSPKRTRVATPPPLHRRGSFVRKPSGEMAYRAPDAGRATAALERHSVPYPSPSAPSSHTNHSAHRKHRARGNRPLTDTIDSLDQVGGIYHHGGPYDATLAAVNANKKKSPLEAVKDSNNEALRATPPEYIQDSLVKHVPLQGTANVPSGMPDRNGRVLHYEEGADLMRESDAPGGAYRRYDFIQYHPDDLKGKGEPSYSIEKALKEHSTGKLRKRSVSLNYGQVGAGAYELQDQPRRSGGGRGGGSKSTRRQSFSHGSTTGASLGGSASNAFGSINGDGNGLSRANSSSHRFADGIKRRIGSLRRK